MKLKVLTYKQLLFSSILVLIIAFSVFPLIFLSENSIFIKKSPKLSAPITINSPVEDETYSLQMEGYYPATYGFEKEEIGEIGKSIDFIDWYSASLACGASIVGIEGGHRNVLVLCDFDNAGEVSIVNSFSSPQTSGTVEYWIRFSDISGSDNKIFMYLRHRSTTIFLIRQWNGVIEYHDGSYHYVMSISENTWYHWRIDFDCTTDTFDFYIDTVLKVDNGNFANKVDNANQILFRTHSSQTYNGFECFIDAVGYSWDPSYDIGDNILGYYPATYGFENDDIGSRPSGWKESSGGYNVVQALKDGHMNVMHLKSSGGAYYTYTSFSERNSGIIEWWQYSTNTINNWYEQYEFRRDTIYLGELYIKSGDLWWYDYNGQATLIYSDFIGSWHHIKIKFSGIDVDIFVDDMKRADVLFKSGEPRVSRLYFNILSGKEAWFDAIGYSWDEEYEEGDNLEQGLLLEFEPDDLPYMAYTLDDWQTSHTILGDTVISMPEDGNYELQVIGQNSGTNYYGNVSFIVDSIDISSPINGTPMEGYFPATFGFENEGDYEVGTSIEFIDTYSAGENSYAKIYPSWQDHEKVLKLRDNDNEDRVYLYNNFDFYKAESTIEFWWGTSSTDPNNAQLRIKLKEGSNTNVELRFWQTYGQLDRIENGHWVPVVSGLSHDTWYHIQIRCLDSMNKYYIFVDGVRYGRFPYVSNTNYGPTRLYFATILDTGYSGYSHYIDAVGYSWDGDYSIGNNKYEGLLLEFEPDDLEWMGYILDDEDPIMISGDTVIPMPDSGIHSLQVFGPNYKSDEINFYIYLDTLHWGLEAINVYDVWHEFNVYGEGVNILVIDTGVYYNHPDLDDNIKGLGEDYIEDDDDPMDERGHGTHCAGIIAAEMNGFGGLGVAPKANIYVSRVLDEYGSNPDTTWTTNPDLASAIDWATETHSDPDPNNDIDIISMSLGALNVYWPEVADAVLDARYEGIFMVASVGNDGGPVAHRHYPSRYTHVFGVGAVMRDGDEIVHWPYSNYVDYNPLDPETLFGLSIVAPGVDIYSTCGDWQDGSEYDGDGVVDGYAIMTGTSMATPMVAGVIALMLEAAAISGCPRNGVRDLLTKTASRDHNDYHKWRWGAGLVDAYAAVEAVLNWYQ